MLGDEERLINMAGIKLSTPLKEEQVRKLRIGNMIELSGTVFCARDSAHKFYHENVDNNPIPDLTNQVIYHCGPLLRQNGEKYEIISAGPTTSMRMSLYTPGLIERYKIRAIIGKGGMDKNTLEAMRQYGCVYLAAIGGTGALMASKIINIKNIYMKEFGMPEAVYELQVEGFPLIVAMDSGGRSIYEEVEKNSLKVVKR